jgi:drug/metabolite transporter (DMT)-like permease
MRGPASDASVEAVPPEVASAPSPRRRRQRWLGFALALAALLIWSGWFVVTRLGVTRDLGVYDIAALRLGVGALALLPAFLQSARDLPRAAWRAGVVLSVCWGAPFVLLLSWGVQLTSAAHAAAITPTAMPVLAGLIGWAALGERPGRRRWAGFALISAGVLALSSTLRTPGRPLDAWLGDASLLAAAGLWAVYTLRVRGTGLTPLQAATLVCLYSSAAYLPIYALSGVSRLGRAPWPELLLQAVYQGVLVSGVSVIAYNRAIGLIGPGAAAAVSSLVPVAAAVLAIPILGEVPTVFTAVAVAAIAAGVLLAARSPERRRERIGLP